LIHVWLDRRWKERKEGEEKKVKENNKSFVWWERIERLEWISIRPPFFSLPNWKETINKRVIHGVHALLIAKENYTLMIFLFLKST